MSRRRRSSKQPTRLPAGPALISIGLAASALACGPKPRPSQPPVLPPQTQYEVAPQVAPPPQVAPDDPNDPRFAKPPPPQPPVLPPPPPPQAPPVQPAPQDVYVNPPPVLPPPPQPPQAKPPQVRPPQVAPVINRKAPVLPPPPQDRRPPQRVPQKPQVPPPPVQPRPIPPQVDPPVMPDNSWDEPTQPPLVGPFDRRR